MIFLKRMFKLHETKSFLFLLALILSVGAVNPQFLQLVSISNCFNDSVVFTLLSIGIAFVILTGEIDVSIGSVLGLTAAVGASLLRDGYSYPLVFIVVIMIGVLLGLINGIGTAVLKIPSLIFTLGTNGVIRGLSYVYTGGKWVENLPASYTKLSIATFVLNITVFYAVVLVLVCVLNVFLTKTQKGKYFAAVGDNMSGARLIGIPVKGVKMGAYVISAVFASLAAMVYVSRIGFVTPMAGYGYEMKAIAACVLGGISLSGGKGRLIGAAIGAVIMSSLSRMLVFLGLSSNYDNTITGILLIVIVVINTLMQNKAVRDTKRKILLMRTADKKGDNSE